MTDSVHDFPRGSEWRRWDLHVHTPYSVLNNQFGGDFDAYAKALLEKAAALGIAAIGVTDYFTIEGYKRLRELLGDRDRLVALVGEDVASTVEPLLVVPNIEFRLREVIHTSGGDARVNLHVLLDPALSPDEIEQNFLHQLLFTAESSPGTPDEEHSLTVGNLSELGRRLKEDHEPFAGQSDLTVGMTTAVLGHETITQVLTRQQQRFRGRYLIVVPADEDLSEINWNGQGHQVRKVLLQKADMFFSANAATRAFALGQKHPTTADYIREFKSRKPCIHGSDAHTFADLFEPDSDRFTWIKADPTFDGLRQLLHEPETRVYIGQQPPALAHVDARATKYITGVTFTRTPVAPSGEKWFSGSVPLNTGLVAIIGNKRSGKSAIADVLGLLGS